MKEEYKYFAFVLMPFAEEYDDVYRIGIQEPAISLGINAERVDDQIYKEGILDRIYRQIEIADLIIADMSGQNANVFYEVGYAHAKEKLCILLTKNEKDIPFDLKHQRHIVYGNSLQVLRDSLKKDLLWAISELDNIRKSKIRVSIKNIFGDLERNRTFAKAKIKFQIDLHNDSNVPSAEIEAIYFYTGQRWTLYQGVNACSNTESDLPDFKNRHFLSTPVKRLLGSGWAQLQFRAERIVASAWKGNILKDSYPIKGSSILRLVTDKGMFDYEVLIDVEAADLPF